MRHFLMPSLPKIIIYVILFFVMPTYYYICTDESCSLNSSFFVITNLLYNRDFGVLTFPGLTLLIILSYLMSCVIAKVAEPFLELKQGHAKK